MTPDQFVDCHCAGFGQLAKLNLRPMRCHLLFSKGAVPKIKEDLLPAGDPSELVRKNKKSSIDLNECDIVTQLEFAKSIDSVLPPPLKLEYDLWGNLGQTVFITMNCRKGNSIRFVFELWDACASSDNQAPGPLCAFLL